MGIQDMIQHIAAVLIGNTLSFVVIYTVYRATKIERMGFSADMLPLPLLLACLVPFGVVIWASSLL